jgi:hypothetical protein
MVKSFAGIARNLVLSGALRMLEFFSETFVTHQ